MAKPASISGKSTERAGTSGGTGATTITDKSTVGAGVAGASGGTGVLVSDTGPNRTRRLAAIVAADVVEYSRLMNENETATHAQFETIMGDIIKPAIAGHGGRIVKSTGDGFLAEFVSAVEAVRCALEFQTAILAGSAETSPERPMLFRVGINVGDVIVGESDIYGHHVNLAARLEQLAEPGGIMISSFVYEYVNGRLACRFEDAGERQVKNIARPIRIFRVLPAHSVLSIRSRAAPLAMTSQVLRLSLFGPVTLRLGRQEIILKSLKSRAVLGYVVLSEARRESRERLVGLLWSESAEPQARAVLRQVIRELRSRLEEEGYRGLQIGAHEIWFDPEAIEVDALSVVVAAEEGKVHPLLLEQRHLADELLAGLEDLDPAFRVWLLAKRHTLRERLLRALEFALADAATGSQQETKLAISIANLDQTHEDACRRLMRARALVGDVAGALRIYKDLWDLLGKDYDMEPSTATQALVAAIKTGNLAPAPSRPPVMEAAEWAPPQPAMQLAISVQAITVSGMDPERAHLVTGFRQHLIASLIRFREWQVTDAPFRDDAPRDPSGPNGRYELLMYVHRNGPAMQLILMLKELENQLYVWSDGFELKLANWFESQRRVVQRIAMALNVHLSAERLRRFSGCPDVSLGMHDRWLRCQTLIRTFKPEHWDYAAAQFMEIIEASPNFVPAYCGLADMHNTEHIVRPGIFRSREREQNALYLARQAVQLDPADMRAHRSLAWANAMAKQYTQAVMHIEIACDLNPNDSWTHISAALLLAFCGDSDRSAELARVALDMALAPSRTHWAYQTDILFLRGDYKAAMDAADRAQNANWALPAWRAAALAHLGRSQEATIEVARFIEQARSNWFGTEAATDEVVLRWMLHLYPISRRDDWERLRDGLRAAGAPVDGLDHHLW